MSTKPPIEGMRALPLGMPCMAGAWLGCLLFCSKDPEALAKFKADTGFDLEGLTKATPLEHAIDVATGHERAVVVAFADWVTKNVWGEVERPPVVTS